MIPDKEFRVRVKAKEPAKVSVAAVLMQSNNVYKGAFETINDLLKTSAYKGDYADVYETNSRWSFEDASWIDTKQPIPINPTLATKQDITDVKQNIADITQDIADIKQDIADINQDIVNVKQEATYTNVRVATLESAIANPVLVITKI